MGFFFLEFCLLFYLVNFFTSIISAVLPVGTPVKAWGSDCWNRRLGFSSRLLLLSFGSCGGLLSLGSSIICGSLFSLLLLGGTLSRGLLALGHVWLRLTALRRGPEGQIVTQELHDQGAVTVGLFGERLELGDGIIEGLLGKVAGTVWGVENLVVEDGEVEGETEADWVS